MTIKKDLQLKLVRAIKADDAEDKYNIRIVLGEFDRISKNPSDDEAIAVLKKLKKLETERLECEKETTSPFLTFIESYLPKQITAEEVTEWAKANIDFSTLKNKMQAVGIIIKHFGQGADGKMVKDVVQGIE